jgi:tRNA-2-methylthio-N6-dimethylallyladenosine synthase
MSANHAKKYFIKTFGCQANIADSNSMMGVLEALGFEEVAEPTDVRNEEEALSKILSEVDLLIINTCSVRQKSEDKVYGMGKSVKKVFEKTGHKPFIVMSGCMVGSVTGDRQRYELNNLKAKTPWVDAYINPAQLSELPGVLIKNRVVGEGVLKKIDLKEVEPKLDNPIHAFVNISYGCDNFCTYCVVPYARGREVSRTQEEILNEIKRLIKRGISEITLCGQNVNSWGLDAKEKFKIRAGSDQKLPFADLLRKVHEIPEIEKIDFLSSNPFDFTTDLIEALKLPKVSKYIHIAVQSGNNDILKKMNRRHTVEEFLKLIKRIKEVKPDMEIGTDLIVGFPTETRNQFMDTVKLVKKAKFPVAFIAMYSPRKGTVAEKLYKDDVSPKEKKYRHAYLTKVWRESKAK